MTNSNLNSNLSNTSNYSCDGHQQVLEGLITFYQAVTYTGYFIKSTGVILNLLNIIILFKAKLNESPYTYLTALAFSDFGALIMSLSFTILVNNTNIESNFINNYQIYIQTPVSNVFLNCSIYFTLALTIERFIFVHSPFKAVIVCRKSIARKVCVGFALFAILKCVYLPFMFVKSKCTEFGFEQIKSTAMDVFEFTSVLALPYLIIFVVNISLIISLNQTNYSSAPNTNHDEKYKLKEELLNKKNRSNRYFGRSSNYKRNSLYRRTSNEKEIRNQKKLTITLIAIICVLLICYLPSFLIQDSILRAIFGDDILSIEKYFAILHPISELLVYANCSVNFIIYCISNKKFYNSLMILLDNSNIFKYMKNCSCSNGDLQSQNVTSASNSTGVTSRSSKVSFNSSSFRTLYSSINPILRRKESNNTKPKNSLKEPI